MKKNENIIGSSPYNLNSENFSKFEENNFEGILKNIRKQEKNNLFRGNNFLRKLYQHSRKLLDFKYALRKIAFDDTLSMSDLPIDFHQNFLAGSHPYGITLSVDQIGSECWIGQLSTLGSNFTNRSFDQKSFGFKPRLGHFVATYPGSIISGPVSIGHCSIISGNAIVTKDVPPFSIVTGVNKISELKSHHFTFFLTILHHQLIISLRPKISLVYSQGKYFENIKLTKIKKYFIEKSDEGKVNEKEFFDKLKSIFD